MTATELALWLRESRGFRHKTDISEVVGRLGRALPGGAAAMAQAVGVGDDCAALPDGDGYLLFAIEGLVEEFVERMPWFAGYCGVMVNVSDVYAMGGRPLAVVDALWSRGMEPGGEVLDGMAAAVAAYGVPIVGGHSNNRAQQGQLAVAVLGRARRLLTSFDARPGDFLLMAIDLRGGFEEPYPYWNASTAAPAARLRGDLDLLPGLAESGLCSAAKDISMAGAVGTALMLLECSGVGGTLDVDAIPRPPWVPLARWLTAFPSYGFVLSVRADCVGPVLKRFAARDIACGVVGEVVRSPRLALRRDGEEAMLWDLARTPFIGAAPAREALHG